MFLVNSFGESFIDRIRYILGFNLFESIIE